MARTFSDTSYRTEEMPFYLSALNVKENAQKVLKRTISQGEKATILFSPTGEINLILSDREKKSY